jgi:hypothetical protein
LRTGQNNDDWQTSKAAPTYAQKAARREKQADAPTTATPMVSGSSIDSQKTPQQSQLGPMNQRLAQLKHDGTATFSPPVAIGTPQNPAISRLLSTKTPQGRPPGRNIARRSAPRTTLAGSSPLKDTITREQVGRLNHDISKIHPMTKSSTVWGFLVFDSFSIRSQPD